MSDDCYTYFDQKFLNLADTKNFLDYIFKKMENACNMR